ncbi:hypothetical protein DXG01_006088 [Tephrocybe rancida]|nr:hypothetical protein DXG01_006088 [Tephrocybe rancida]
MPGNVGRGPGSFFGGNLTAFVQNGQIPRDRLMDMATRVLAGWYFLHQDSPSFPAVNFNGNQPGDEATNEHIDVQDDHYKVVREIGAASTVLLKNERGALPLKRPRNIFLAGSDAGPARVAGPNEFRDQGGNDGILAMGGGSGLPYEALQARARKDRTTVSWIFDDFNVARAGNMAIGNSAAIVFVNSDSSEGSDRTNLTAWHGGDNLILAVAAQNNNTIVVVHSVGQLIVEPWIDHPNVTAVRVCYLSTTRCLTPPRFCGPAHQVKKQEILLQMSYMETGIHLVDFHTRLRSELKTILLKSSSEVHPEPSSPSHIQKGLSYHTLRKHHLTHHPRLLIGYRGFDARNITPRFEFGFGLSYTQFKYSNLHISKVSSPSSAEQERWDQGNSSLIEFGSTTALW